MAEWVTGNVVQVKHWTENLFSLIVHAPIFPFIAGQFTKLGIEINGKKIQRAYSYVNAPKNKNLEFYLTVVSEGKLSSKLHKLTIGDSIIIDKKASGNFTLQEIPKCKNLWMIGTGTAIGPYLSILEQGSALERFYRIILIHAVRFSQDLSYLPQMVDLRRLYNGKLIIQTVVSREKTSRSLFGRVTDLIVDGSLENSVNIQLNSKDSHVMLCGNPNMVRDVQQVLNIKYGMYRHFKLKPGHVTIENYW